MWLRNGSNREGDLDILPSSFALLSHLYSCHLLEKLCKRPSENGGDFVIISGRDRDSTPALELGKYPSSWWMISLALFHVFFVHLCGGAVKVSFRDFIGGEQLVGGYSPSVVKRLVYLH